MSRFNLKGSIAIQRDGLTPAALREFLIGYLREYYREDAVRPGNDGVEVRGRPFGPLKRCFSTVRFSLQILGDDLIYSIEGRIAPSDWRLVWLILGLLICPVVLLYIFEIGAYYSQRNASRDYLESAVEALAHFVSKDAAQTHHAESQRPR